MFKDRIKQDTTVILEHWQFGCEVTNYSYVYIVKTLVTVDLVRIHNKIY
jgi:hypothetical protein